MKKLYVIGNGFDLHHNLDTSYKSFADFLESNYLSIYDNLLEYYGFPDIANKDDELSHKDSMWHDFETNLSDINIDLVLENFTDYCASPSSSDFRDSDWYSFQIEIEKVVNELTDELFKSFKKFIQNVKYPPKIDNEAITIDKSAQFLNFNYTDTLEVFYKIPNKNILYIHGNVNHGEQAILGHGINPKTFELEAESIPKGLSPEKHEKWEEYMNNKYNHSYELGKYEMMEYFSKSYKDTKSILMSYNIFFSDLHDIEEVIVLGHSLSTVDRDYFLEIVKYISKNATWKVSYYSESEKESHIETLIDIGIKKNTIELIKIIDLLNTKSN